MSRSRTYLLNLCRAREVKECHIGACMSSTSKFADCWKKLPNFSCPKSGTGIDRATHVQTARASASDSNLLWSRKNPGRAPCLQCAKHGSDPQCQSSRRYLVITQHGESRICLVMLVASNSFGAQPSHVWMIGTPCFIFVHEKRLEMTARHQILQSNMCQWCDQIYFSTRPVELRTIALSGTRWR